MGWIISFSRPRTKEKEYAHSRTDIYSAEKCGKIVQLNIVFIIHFLLTLWFHSLLDKYIPHLYCLQPFRTNFQNPTILQVSGKSLFAPRFLSIILQPEMLFSSSDVPSRVVPASHDVCTIPVIEQAYLGSQFTSPTCQKLCFIFFYSYPQHLISYLKHSSCKINTYWTESYMCKLNAKPKSKGTP